MARYEKSKNKHPYPKKVKHYSVKNKPEKKRDEGNGRGKINRIKKKMEGKKQIEEEKQTNGGGKNGKEKQMEEEKQTNGGEKKKWKEKNK